MQMTHKMSYAKNWCGTLNNWCDEDRRDLEQAYNRGYLLYLIYAEEVSATGTPHLQIYLCCKERRRLTWLRENLSDVAHWEIMRGTPLQASTYCKKPSTEPEKIHEFGSLQKTPSQKGGESTKAKWTDIHDLARTDATEIFLQEHPREAFLHLRNFQALCELYRSKPTSLAEMTHWWYQGSPGTGKSRTARTLFPNAYIKPTSTKWWPGYAGEREVIIDDLGKDHAYVLEWLKNWADHYPFQAENKGGHTGMIRPHSIIVTSNYHWDELTSDTQLRQAMSRRFTIKRFGSGLGETSFSKETSTITTPSGRAEESQDTQRQSPDTTVQSECLSWHATSAERARGLDSAFAAIELSFNPDQFAQENEDFGEDCSCFEDE